MTPDVANFEFPPLLVPGVGLAPVWLGDATPGVATALPGLPPIAYPVWLAAHRELRTSRRIRLVHDLLAAEIPAALAG